MLQICIAQGPRSRLLPIFSVLKYDSSFMVWSYLGCFPGGNGKCEKQKCTCNWGFEGPDCQQDKRTQSECPLPSLFDKEGDCCKSGVFDFDGNCCKGSNDELEIDAQGKCCIGKKLDAAGSCTDEPDFVDVAGNLCPVRHLPSID